MGSMVAAFARAAAALGARIGCRLLAAALCGSLAGSLWAGEARLIEGSSPEGVVLEAADAGVDEVLAVLAKQFQFTVERNAASGQTMRFSGRLQGSLDQVLERLLRNEGHMIVRSSEAHAGISRVVLFEAGKSGAGLPTAAGPLAGPIAALKAKIREHEEGTR
jgi:hypothetical protein